MSGAIVSFVGQNENGILRHLSHGLMSLMEPFGYTPQLIDLADPDWPNQLETVLKSGVAMAWGHAGIGAGLQIEGQNLWERIQVPFVSVLADSPCWRPCNHAVASRFVVNAYLYPEWLSVQRQFIRSSQVSAVVQGGLIPNPLRDSIAWRDRPRRMVLVKTGGDPVARREGWAALPARMRAVLEDAGHAATALPTGDITGLLIEAAAAHQITFDGRTDILFGLMAELDLYVRDSRSTALVAALLDVPADIYGRGWDHISHRAGRARFHPAIGAGCLPQIYAETQYMLNTTPNFASGVHERVAYGLDARCCVLSDQNAYMRDALHHIPTFSGFDPTDSALPQWLAAQYNDPTDYTDLAEPALAFTAEAFDGVRYMRSLLDLADGVRAGERFADYRH